MAPAAENPRFRFTYRNEPMHRADRATVGAMRQALARERRWRAAHCSIVTSVPIGVYFQISAEAASGSSTQPRLWGVPNDDRSKLCSASPPLK